MNNPFEADLIETSDGSHTLKLRGFKEQYHSVNGALQESQHVFLNSGYQAMNPMPDPLYILEVGLGTGLNALITAREAINHKNRVLYDAIEPYPLQKELTERINYADLLPESWLRGIFNQIHDSHSTLYQNLKDYFFFRCDDQPLQEKLLDKERYHLVYFDAFGPDTQPDMWTDKVFGQLYESMKPGGILVTYCVKGEVRRAMKAAGFDVHKIPGPAGKREISRATKPL